MTRMCALLILVLGLTTTAAAAETVGAHALAVLLINYADQVNPVTLTAERATAAAVETFYAQASYGTLALTVDVFGPYTVAQTSGACGGFAPTQAAALARAAGVDLDAYDGHVFVFPPSPSCPRGAGVVLGLGTPYAWINGTYDLHLHLHEIGHMLGMFHSESLTCPGLLALCPIPPGIRVDYGDGRDIMGSGGIRHPNAAQKIQMGWLDPSPGTNGTHRLTPVVPTPSALWVARVYDDGLVVSYEPIDGVRVHWQRFSTGGIALSPLLLNLRGPNKRLPVGRRWVDPDTGRTILVDAAAATDAQVSLGQITAQAVTETFVRTVTPQTWTIRVPPFACQRVATGGTNAVRILETVNGVDVIRKQAGVVAPALGQPFTVTCDLSFARTTAALNGVVKVTYTP